MRYIYVYKKHGGIFSLPATIGTICVNYTHNSIILQVYRGYYNHSIFDKCYLGSIEYYEPHDSWTLSIPHNGLFTSRKSFDITNNHSYYIVHSPNWIEGVNGVTTSSWEELNEDYYLHRKAVGFALALLFGDLLKK